MRSNLFQWGIIYDHRNQKRIKSHLPTESSIKEKSSVNMIQIACGTNFTIVLNSDGRILVVGDEPKHGRLGLGDQTTIAPQLTYINNDLPPMDFISCGPATTILVTQNRRELWAFGKGIGPIVTRIYQNEKIITHCACNENSILIVIDGSHIEERHFNRTGFINDWTCVYRIPNSNDRIQDLDLGSSLGGFITQLGHIYLWGIQVPRGRNTTEEQFINISIESPYQVDLIVDQPMKISCSRGQFHSHALLLTEQGSIYSIGSNYKGKLGIDKSILFTGQWMLIKLTIPYRFQMIAAGGIHSSALSTDGQVFTWGCGSDGRLGHVESENHRYLYKETEARVVESLMAHRCIAIATSYYHMAAIVHV